MPGRVLAYSDSTSKVIFAPKTYRKAHIIVQELNKILDESSFQGQAENKNKTVKTKAIVSHNGNITYKKSVKYKQCMMKFL